jgi:hypothetical protein
MNQKEFEQLLDKSKYQVFIFASSANFPFSFGLHLWFVLNRQGEISRWEVLYYKDDSPNSWGHLYKNMHRPIEGLTFFPFILQPRWSSHLVSIIESESAHKVIECIEKSSETYPYCYQYSLTGPNSNTYVQWVLDQFPESKLHLPWNAFGKNYLSKSKTGL